MIAYLVYCPFFVAACTTENSHFRPNIAFGDLGAASDQGSLHADDAGTIVASDLGVVAVECNGAQRRCAMTSNGSASKQTQRCVTGQFVDDRLCSTSCADGSCAPPASSGIAGIAGSSCAGSDGGDANENACLLSTALNLSCEPFFNDANSGTNSNGAGGGDNALVWQCAPIVGMGLPTDACTSGATCRSGFCGSNGTCFRACGETVDCPMYVNNIEIECHDVTIQVEGHKVTAGSCIPKK